MPQGAFGRGSVGLWGPLRPEVPLAGQLIEAFPAGAFTIPHFDGYAAVLLRLPLIAPDLLREFVIDSWLLKARKRTSRAWLDEQGLEG